MTPTLRSGIPRATFAGGKEEGEGDEMETTSGTITIEVDAEDVARLHALSQMCGIICPGTAMKEWCQRFYLRLLPLRMGVATHAAVVTKGASK